MQCSPVWDLETGNKKEKPAKPTSQVGGGLGIRTLGALQHTTFRVGVVAVFLRLGSVNLLPLDILSAFYSCVSRLRLIVGDSP